MHAAVFTTESEHSYLSDPDYVAAWRALSAWVAGGAKLTPETVADGGVPGEAEFGAGCFVDPRSCPVATRAGSTRGGEGLAAGHRARDGEVGAAGVRRDGAASWSRYPLT